MSQPAKPAVAEDEESSIKLQLLHTFVLLWVLIRVN